MSYYPSPPDPAPLLSSGVNFAKHTMDFLKNHLSGSGGNSEQKNLNDSEESSRKGKSGGGLFGHLNSALGGGESGEKKEGTFSRLPPTSCRFAKKDKY